MIADIQDTGMFVLSVVTASPVNSGAVSIPANLAGALHIQSDTDCFYRISVGAVATNSGADSNFMAAGSMQVRIRNGERLSVIGATSAGTLYASLFYASE